MTDDIASAIENYAIYKLRDYHRAQDVVQEVRLRLHKQDKKIDNPKAWAYRVARNLCLDILRKDNRLKPLPQTDILPKNPGEYDPAHLAEEKERKMLLARKIKDLPEKQQEAVRLKFQEGLSYNEIAQVMEESVPTVGWLLHTALQKLRTQMVNT